MKVTSIKKLKKKYLIDFDNEEKLFLYEDVLIDAGLHVGDEISYIELNDFRKLDNIYTTRNSAFRYLARREHSKKELKTKLIAKKYSEDIVEEVLTDLTARGYINESKFIENFVRDKILLKKDGIRKIKAQLVQKGVFTDNFDEVIESIDLEEVYCNNIEELASKKARTVSGEPIIQKQKIFSYLLNKGYETDLIKQTISKIQLEEK
ncbi:MAG: recombination regulator RecX [Melioribacteraceae bacterium]|nr:recombination regulator RecX [Melioribacteraceae bacterium]